MLHRVGDDENELDCEVKGATFDDDVHSLLGGGVPLHRIGRSFVGHIPDATDDQRCDHNVCAKGKDEAG